QCPPPSLTLGALIGGFRRPALALGLGRGLGGVVAAAADRRAVHEHATGAARLHHAAQAVAAGLDHLTALGVAAGAGEADAVGRHLAVAHAHGQVAAAHDHAVHHDAAAAHAAGEHRAQVLHHAAGHLVVARTGNLHAAGALLELVRAARHHHEVDPDRHAGWRPCRGCAHPGDAHPRHRHAGPFHHHRARHEPNSFLEPPPPPPYPSPPPCPRP